MKDKDQIKQIRKEARKGWRNKKANKKALEDIQKEAIAGKKVIRLPSYREKKQNKPRATQNTSYASVARQKNQSMAKGKIPKSSCALAHLGTATWRMIEMSLWQLRNIKKGKCSLDYLKREVHHEAKMINQLDDHHGVPLLFGIMTKSEPFSLITKFHG